MTDKCLMKTIGTYIAATLLILSGCAKDVVTDNAVVFGGPAEVALVLSSGSSSSRSVPVDETDPVRSVRIFAFKHDPGNPQHEEMVGYGYYRDITGAGPHRFSLDLTASGPVDFYVLANDGSVEPDSGLGPESSRSDIENVRFEGLDQNARVAVIPMSNVRTGDVTGDNNMTFLVREGSALPQIIHIDVTRAMARMSFYFAKSMESTTVSVNSVTLAGQGPGSAGYFSADGNPGNWFYGSAGQDLLDSPVSIGTVNAGGSLDEASLQNIPGAETYLLPDTYGSSDPDVLPAGTSYQTSVRTYIVDVGYSVNGAARTKRIYLPAVSPNDWLKVKAVINEKVDVSLNVIIENWTDHEIEIPPFS